MSKLTSFAPSRLTAGLIDDAAIFPPGLAPLDEAVRRHQALRTSPLASYVGPFLLRASWWPAFTELTVDTDSFDVVLICRPDDDATTMVSDIEAAVRGLTDHAVAEQPHHPQRLRGVEMPWAGPAVAQTIETLLASPGSMRQVAFEIDGSKPDVDLAAIRACGAKSVMDILGKFRTGGVRPDDSPPADRLAGVIAAAAAHRTPVKFTAGLHHAVTGPHGPGGSIQYGVLNVIAAVRQSLSAVGAQVATHDAALAGALSATLRRTDAASLAAEAIALSDDAAAEVRSVFVSFGCCGVAEPLGELAALGVIPPGAADVSPPPPT